MTDYKNTPEGRRAAQKYADIIHLDRPASSRPKMDLVHRAKIFSPYDALRGFDEAIEHTEEEGNRVQKVLLSDTELSALSDQLSCLKKGMSVSVTYFAGDADDLGNYRTAKGILKKIDPLGQTLEIEEKTPDTTGGKLEKVLPTVIEFNDLLEIKIHAVSARDSGFQP